MISFMKYNDGSPHKAMTLSDASLKQHYSQSQSATEGMVISGYVLFQIKILTVFATYKECCWQNIDLGLEVSCTLGIFCSRKIIRVYEN